MSIETDRRWQQKEMNSGAMGKRLLLKVYEEHLKRIHQSDEAEEEDLCIESKRLSY